MNWYASNSVIIVSSVGCTILLVLLALLLYQWRQEKAYSGKVCEDTIRTSMGRWDDIPLESLYPLDLHIDQTHDQTTLVIETTESQL